MVALLIISSLPPLMTISFQAISDIKASLCFVDGHIRLLTSAKYSQAVLLCLKMVCQ